MGETIEMSVWVDVANWNTTSDSPIVWTQPPGFKVNSDVKRYQINFEVPKPILGITAEVEGEVVEVLD